MALGQFAATYGPGIARGLGVTAAMTGGAGLVGAGGDPRGIPAGMMGSFGGGISGAFSGAVLGGIAGLAFAGAAMFHPATRKFAARHIGDFLGGKTRLLGRTAPQMGRALESSQLAQYMPIFQQANALPMAFAKDAAARGVTPHMAAMQHTITFLNDKKRRMMAMGIGGGVAATAGMFIGAPAGLVTRAYQSGRNV